MPNQGNALALMSTALPQTRRQTPEARLFLLRSSPAVMAGILRPQLVRWHQAGSNAMRMRRCLTAPALLSLLTLVFSTGCGSSATTSTATSPTSINRCAVTASGNGQVPAQGGRRQPRRQRRPRMRVVGVGRKPVADHQDRRDRAGRRRHRIQRRRQRRPGGPTRRHRVERTARRGEPGGRRVRLFAAGGIGQLPAGGRRRAVRGPRLQRPVLVDGAVRCRLGVGAGRCQQPGNRHSSVRRRGGRRPDTQRHDHRRRAPLQHRPVRCELYLQCRSRRLHRRRRRGRAHGHGDDRHRPAPGARPAPFRGFPCRLRAPAQAPAPPASAFRRRQRHAVARSLSPGERSPSIRAEEARPRRVRSRSLRRAKQFRRPAVRAP